MRVRKVSQPKVHSHKTIPPHLLKYVVDQDYGSYTAEDQAVWRFTMRQLRDYLSRHAHSCYVDGLEKTGISIDQIPAIAEIDAKIKEFGWGAIPVSGFIPPAAFMEFQSLGFLPIAADIRTVEHILYTPAPDIVHEAAGHAPILIEPGFAAYLKSYAEVAAHAIVSSEDMNLYRSIRDLSDIKENPDSTPVKIKEAETHLQGAVKSLTFVSEAARLGRMNWWTAEYGLIGDVKNPKIFGAGLLSSIGESRSCMDPAVKKLPLTLSCLDFSYDITEPQPQLFVTPDFKNLEAVLEELSNTMAYKKGGLFGLEKAKEAKTVNTVMLNSGIQISGILSSIKKEGKQPTYLKFSGPCQLAYDHHELEGHDRSHHKEGFGTPVGRLENADKCLSEFTAADLKKFKIIENQNCHLQFESGVEVKGLLTNKIEKNGCILVLSFKDCRVTEGSEILFDPSWGIFDMAVGSSIPSVFGGPADREAFGEVDDFHVVRVPHRKVTTKDKKLFEFYFRLRELRESKVRDVKLIEQLSQEYFKSFAEHWLPGLEIFEIMTDVSYSKKEMEKVREHLMKIAKTADESTRFCIENGLRLV